MKRIVTVTLNPCVDKSCQAESIVANRKLRCTPPRYEPGGGGINVARAIRELGGEATAIYPRGGPTGDRLSSLLDEQGVRSRPIKAQAWTRENLVVTEEASGNQYRFGMPGAELSEGEFEACLQEVEQVGGGDCVVASGSLPPGLAEDAFARLARTAKDCGARLFLDTSGQSLRDGLEEGVFLAKPNLRELNDITDEDIEWEEEQECVGRSLVDSGACAVLLVSLGAAGAMVVSDDGPRRVRSPSVPIRSRVGAGDSMMAGVVLGIAQGNDLDDAVRLGIAAGAAATMTPASALCRREDVERLYARLKDESVAAL